MSQNQVDLSDEELVVLKVLHMSVGGFKILPGNFECPEVINILRGMMSKKLVKIQTREIPLFNNLSCTTYCTEVCKYTITGLGRSVLDQLKKSDSFSLETSGPNKDLDSLGDNGNLIKCLAKAGEEVKSFDS